MKRFHVACMWLQGNQFNQRTRNGGCKPSQNKGMQGVMPIDYIRSYLAAKCYVQMTCFQKQTNLPGPIPTGGWL